MALRLESIRMNEYINRAYRCPKCRGYMSSGLQLENADDEWLVFPHCTECEYEGLNPKRPYDDCIPAQYRAEVYKMGVYVAPAFGRERDRVVVDIQVTTYGELPRIGPATQFIGFLPLVEVVRKQDESDSAFWVRAHEEARQKVAEIAGPIKMDRASIRIMEDPGFYRFGTK